MNTTFVLLRSTVSLRANGSCSITCKWWRTSFITRSAPFTASKTFGATRRDWLGKRSKRGRESSEPVNREVSRLAMGSPRVEFPETPHRRSGFHLGRYPDLRLAHRRPESRERRFDILSRLS